MYDGGFRPPYAKPDVTPIISLPQPFGIVFSVYSVGGVGIIHSRMNAANRKREGPLSL